MFLLMSLPFWLSNKLWWSVNKLKHALWWVYGALFDIIFVYCVYCIIFVYCVYFAYIYCILHIWYWYLIFDILYFVYMLYIVLYLYIVYILYILNIVYLILIFDICCSVRYYNNGRSVHSIHSFKKTKLGFKIKRHSIKMSVSRSWTGENDMIRLFFLWWIIGIVK